MKKLFYEFDNETELSRHLKYWSNACGDLHHNGEYDLNDVSELPEELQRAYIELWKEGNGCYEYLVEYDGKYYIALVSEFDDDFADDINISMEELYDTAKRNALELYQQDLFKNTVLVLGKGTGVDECHEVMFLVPAMESENVYDEIENTIYENIWKVSREDVKASDNGTSSMRLAQEIIEIFEEYLEEKGVKINNPEREGDDSAAQIYGTEYGELESKINELLSGIECVLNTSMGTVVGVIAVEDGSIIVSSEQLDEYLEKYSME